MILKLLDNSGEYEKFEEIGVIGTNKPPQISDGELYELALGCVIKNSEISINHLRKISKVGFKRAKKIIDQLENNKIIEAYSGGGSSRSIKVPKEKLSELDKRIEEDNKPSFSYVNHVLKIPAAIDVVEEDEL
ncbi:DNA translocase FtsK (plasmid) [Rossellomorea sp. AcN35-11]|nr:hypothetical protein [Rossellomorea aquimaris]WJV32111.1 DNA translocase FtsK [Rossellomorea sp. AcN35-11]